MNGLSCTGVSKLWISALLLLSSLAPISEVSAGTTLRPTMYSTKVVQDTGGGSRSTVKVLKNGRTQSVSVPKAFRSKLALEGAGILVDANGQKRVLSYWKPGVYIELPASEYPAGGTARSVNRKQCPRVPFKTIAVGPGMRLGSKVFIPKTKGLRFPLPNGQTYVHDGIWYAEDHGSAIGNGRADLFLGNQRAEEVEGLFHSTLNTRRSLAYERRGTVNKCAIDDISSSLADQLFRSYRRNVAQGVTASNSH
jgi:3D (Asp-Asp-Asp) domain-containing protein